MSRRAVFLDRDGVINSYVYNQEFGTVDSPGNPDEFRLLPGVCEAIEAFRAMGYLVVVVSNQPGIAKGRFSPELLRATTDVMLAECQSKIDAVYYCLHHPHAAVPMYQCDCTCRKPKPGLLFQAAADWTINLAESVMIGDGLTDVMAGRSAGARTILVSRRKCYLCDAMTEHNASPDFLISSLSEAVQVVRSLDSVDAATIQGAYRCELLGHLH